MASITSSQGMALSMPDRAMLAAGHGVHCAHYVPFHAGHFHQAGHRVADQAQQVAQGHGRRGRTGRGRAAFQVTEGRGGHGAGGAHLGLAAALGAGEGWPGRRSPARSPPLHTAPHRWPRRRLRPPGPAAAAPPAALRSCPPWGPPRSVSCRRCTRRFSGLRRSPPPGSPRPAACLRRRPAPLWRRPHPPGRCGCGGPAHSPGWWPASPATGGASRPGWPLRSGGSRPGRCAAPPRPGCSPVRGRRQHLGTG